MALDNRILNQRLCSTPISYGWVRYQINTIAGGKERLCGETRIAAKPNAEKCLKLLQNGQKINDCVPLPCRFQLWVRQLHWPFPFFSISNAQFVRLLFATVPLPHCPSAEDVSLFDCICTFCLLCRMPLLLVHAQLIQPVASPFFQNGPWLVGNLHGVTRVEHASKQPKTTWLSTPSGLGRLLKKIILDFFLTHK